MRPRKTEAEKKRMGRPPYRTFHTEMTFRLSPHLHEEMKDIAFQQKVYLEDIYGYAVTHLLDLRERQELIYHAAPNYRSSKRVTVKMEPNLKARVFAATNEDKRSIANFFETAAFIYIREKTQQNKV
ncbi:MAG: hypothetical protein WAS21_02795 [Geminicoccaceae bacterium]